MQVHGHRNRRYGLLPPDHLKQTWHGRVRQCNQRNAVECSPWCKTDPARKMGGHIHGHWKIHRRLDFDNPIPGHRQIDGMAVFWWRDIRGAAFSPFEGVPAARKNGDCPVGGARVGSTGENGAPELGSAARPVAVHIDLQPTSGWNGQVIRCQRNQFQFRITGIKNCPGQYRSAPTPIGIIDVLERRMHLSFINSPMICGFDPRKGERLIKQVSARLLSRIGFRSVSGISVVPDRLCHTRGVVHVHSSSCGGTCAFHPASDHADPCASSHSRPHWDAAGQEMFFLRSRQA